MTAGIEATIAAAAPSKYPRFWIVTTGILAFLAIVVAAIYADRQVTLAAGRTNLTAKAEIVVEHVEQILRMVDLGIRALDENPMTPADIELPRRDFLQVKLRLLEVGTDALQAIAFIGSDGKIYASATGATAPTVDLRERPYFQRHLNDPSLGMLVSQPVRASTSGQVLVPVSRGVFSGGQFEGVIAGGLDPGYFEEFFRRIDAESVALVLNDGTPVAHWPRMDLLRASPFRHSSLTFGGREPEPLTPMTGYFEVDGTEKILQIKPLRVASLGLVVTMNVDSILERWKLRRNVLLVAATMIVGLVVSLAVVDARRMREKTVRREAEALAAVSKHMQALAIDSSRRKSEFLAHMSHEIRTPLNAIIGFSEVMKDGVFGTVAPAKYQSYVSDIHYSANHLLSVVNNVLDLSKVEAGKWKQDTVEVPLVDLIGAVRRLSAPSAEREDVRIVVSGVPLAFIRGDERMLRQILLNLLTNAIRFAGSEKSVELVSELSADGSLRISVTDHGPGLSATDIVRVLRPFETASDTQTKQRQDTGLGLPLARMFAEMHDGELTIESAPDAGTTVSLRLPASRVGRV